MALITVPPSMTKRCYIKSQHNGQIYVIYLFPINLVHFIGTNLYRYFYRYENSTVVTLKAYI